jgi:hypothetical protein
MIDATTVARAFPTRAAGKEGAMFFGAPLSSSNGPTLLCLLRKAAMNFEDILGQGKRTTSDRLVGISQATIEERVARLEELDPAITEIVRMLRHRLDELEERVAALETARDR